MKTGCGSSVGIMMPLWMQAVPRSITAPGTFSHEDSVMETCLRPFFFFRSFKTEFSCQLIAAECMLSTGKISGRLAQKSVARITDMNISCLPWTYSNKAIIIIIKNNVHENGL